MQWLSKKLLVSLLGRDVNSNSRAKLMSRRQRRSRRAEARPSNLPARRSPALRRGLRQGSGTSGRPVRRRCSTTSVDIRRDSRTLRPGVSPLSSEGCLHSSPAKEMIHV